MAQPIYQVDAFAERPFTGNPAGVCLLEREGDTAWMQSVAQEMSLSETAFAWPHGAGFGLRWFTPTVEVDLCGHATLATAHVLWSTSRLGPESAAQFDTARGRLVCRRLDDGRIEMDFPAEPPRACPAPDALAGLFDGEPLWVGRSRLDWLVELGGEGELRALAPRMDAVERAGLRGLIVTARAEPGASHDFVSRFFAPQSGVPEDPVTGSAHCALAPFWAERLGRAPLVGFQASRRGGLVEVEPRGERVLLRGRAVTVLSGRLEVS